MQTGQGRMAKAPQKEPAMLCAFVRILENADATLQAHGCRKLAEFGNIYIANIPLSQLPHLSQCTNVTRIEAGEPCTLTNDTSAIVVNALPAYEGLAPLPQAFTGKGVVVGVEDIGFDLTHPTFYSRDLSEYRVKRFWDQLSVDTIGSSLPVGAEYITQEEILGYQRSRDGSKQTHGTHTAGTAAGSGYDSPYRGIAFESDLCLVSNYVGNDREFLRDEDVYKYTSATDALGFKYIFDYADSRGLPCVVSFSEGAHQDLYGDDVLLYEVLSQMVGPGHIIVASAGNEGHVKTYLHKEKGVEARGTFIGYSKNAVYFTFRSDQHFDVRMNVFNNADAPDVVTKHTADIYLCADSLLVDTVDVAGEPYAFMMAAYPTCYDETKMAVEVYVKCLTGNRFGYDVPIAFEMVGEDADVELFSSTGTFIDREGQYAGMFCDGENTHSVYTPGSAPDVICVGATGYRTRVYNIKGQWRVEDHGENGERSDYSGVGPTFYGAVKPDVMAPGTNVISAYSSFYISHYPNLVMDVQRFDFNGRTYAWHSDFGTSMSTPIVAAGIAIWLQAKPDLTPDDVKAIFSRTCKRYDPALEYPNNWYGHGEIDIYRGLLDVLGVSGIREISQEQSRNAQLSLADGVLSVSFADSPRQPFRVTLFSTDGRKLKSCSCGVGETARITTAGLPKGVYIVQIDSREELVKGSSVIRL